VCESIIPRNADNRALMEKLSGMKVTVKVYVPSY